MNTSPTHDTPDSVNQLKTKLAQTARLGQINALLDWDQQTQMPPGAAEARSEQAATLAALIHELSTSDAMAKALTTAEADVQNLDPDSDEARLVKVARRDFDIATKLPAALVEEKARHTALAQEIWVRARQTSDFERFAPALEKMLDLTRQEAQHLGYQNHLYDALIDLYEPGTTHADVAAMFQDVKPHLIQLTQAIADSSKPVDDAPIRGNFAIETQRTVTLQAAKAVGYDTNRGRQDEAAHPFCTNFSRDDVRITTRYAKDFLQQGLYATLHEAGHAMYEQGSPIAFESGPLAGGASLGVHESQSRLWENLVGRSRAFSRWFYPTLQSAFPDHLGQYDAEAYYRAVNKVEPSLIRVEADEVTYNLHILMRFEIESALLTEQLAVDDLPDAWDAKMQEYLGLTPPTDSDGCLQDVHWSVGLIGYFPTYSIGNLLSAQLWNRLSQDLPDVMTQIETGEFAPLLDWLHAHVHDYGRKYLPRELVQKATGEPLTSRYYVAYLNEKYGDIYGL